MRLEPEELRDRAKEFRDCSEDMEQIVSHMQVMITNLGEEWEGKSYEGFLKQFEELKPQLDKTVLLGRDIGEQLDSIATNFEDVDNYIAERIG